jgi:hypothetical protein
MTREGKGISLRKENKTYDGQKEMEDMGREM